MTIGDLDIEMRMRAFGSIRDLLSRNGVLTANDLKAGFEFRGERVPLINPQRGIFKPKQMKHLLSIRTVFPKVGAKVWYDDQRLAHSQIFSERESVEYAFMGSDPAHESRVPIIYFLGISPGRYEALIPAFICGWDRELLKARVSFNSVSNEFPLVAENSGERRYALREVQQRLHQASFREAVITAYDGRCALSNLPEALLLDAAHIVSDKDEQLGQPVVPNGIPLTKIHHAAFDAHLIGIDADFKIHVSERLLSQNDGPMLEALKQLKGRLLRLPTRTQDYPSQERLASRFEKFRAAS